MPVSAQTASTAEVTSVTAVNERRIVAIAVASVTAWRPLSARSLRASGTGAPGNRTQAPVSSSFSSGMSFFDGRRSPTPSSATRSTTAEYAM